MVCQFQQRAVAKHQAAVGAYRFGRVTRSPTRSHQPRRPTVVEAAAGAINLRRSLNQFVFPATRTLPIYAPAQNNVARQKRRYWVNAVYGSAADTRRGATPTAN